MMMNTYKVRLIAFFAAVILVVSASGATAAGKAKLVSVDWLARNLRTPNVVILDVGAFTQYERSHVPGAVRAFGPWQTMNDQFVGFMMRDVEDLVRMLRNYGVNNSSYVIVYDEGVTAQDTAKSARVLWTLHALGHDRVAILDGGFAAWKQKGKKVSTKATVPRPGDFTGKLIKSKLATMDEVKEALRSSGAVFVDDRLPEEDFGHEKKSYIKRYGHLPGSRLWPADFMTNAGIEFSPSFMRDTTELKQMAKGIGIPADKNVEIITYSTRGIQAAMGYYVLHDLLGYKNVKLFDGSILEAAADKSVPMNTNGWGYKKKM
ncbi:MAG: rhodanese-like domain-containing protein [Candidatus Sulfobium sp.]|jgi:thiosulfate/3-mercaptopyruvate sulfurtransferase